MNSTIHTPTPNLAQSIEFYSKLGFQVQDNGTSKWVSDGKAIIEINPDRYARAGLKFYKDSWADELVKLNDITTVGEKDGMYVFSMPCGTWIYLAETSTKPELAFDGKTPSTLGNYAGLSIEAIAIKESAPLWDILGFRIVSGSAADGWVSLTNDDGMTVNIMKPFLCPHLFFNPSLTYFNGKENNPKVIADIRKSGVAITEEITHFNKEGIVDNIIIRDPGGLGLFIFND